MSQADIQRFVSDLKANQGLLDEVKSGAVGLASLVELAQARGYDFTADEARAYIRGQASQELSDEQLDAVAGGKGHQHHSSATQSAVQSAVVASINATAAATASAIQSAVTNLSAETDVEVEVTAVAVAVVAIVG